MSPPTPNYRARGGGSRRDRRNPKREPYDALDFGFDLFSLPLLILTGLLFTAFVLLAGVGFKDPGAMLRPGMLLGDGHDALTGVWNFWWMRDSLLERHASPWTCKLLFHPFGADLHGHSLNPLAGVVGLLFPGSIGPETIHNILLAATFPLTAWAALVMVLQDRGRKAWVEAGIVGGLFALSAYRMAHAHGHLNLMMTMFLPLFIAAWRAHLREPTLHTGLLAAMTLSANLWSEPLYFVYALMAGMLLLGWEIWERRDAGLLLHRAFRGGWISFVLSACMLCGPALYGFIHAARHERFVGGHPAEDFSMDLLAPFVPGAFSCFGGETHGVWERFNAGVIEGSVHFGSLFTLMGLIGLWRGGRRMGPWGLLAGVFFVLALGPRLQIAGHVIKSIPLPYALLEWLVPPLRLSGTPVRMAMMAHLALLVPASETLAAMGKRIETWASRHRRWIRNPYHLGLIILIPLITETASTPPPLTPIHIPGYAAWLRNQPGRCAVIDTVNLPPGAMLAQTLHGKPIAFGYVSKRSRPGLREDGFLHFYINRWLDTGVSPQLLQYYGFSFIVVSNDTVIPGLDENRTVAWRDEFTKVINLEEQQRITPELLQ